MRHVWIFLMLCSAAWSAAAQCPPAAAAAANQAPARAQVLTQTQGTSPAQATSVKVSAVAQAPQPLPQAGDAEAPPRWRQHPLGAPLLVTGLVMAVIALRRGGR